jgi:type IV fimbrial biogenesis protein FimT
MLASMIMKRRFRAIKVRIAGLTLIEVLIGVAVLGVIVAVAVPSMSDLLERRRVIAAAEEVAGILNYAKAETNATNSELDVNFQPDPAMSCVVVAQAVAMNRCQCNRTPASTVCQNSSATSLRLFRLPKTHVRFDAAATWGSPANRYYLKFSREQSVIALPDFRVDVTGLKKGYNLRVEVNTIGRVKICSPSGTHAITGYGSCTPITP